MPRGHLHIVEPSPWNKPAAYRPDLLEALARNERRLRSRPSFFATLAADAREAFDDPFFTFFVGGVLGSLLVCVAAFFWSAL